MPQKIEYNIVQSFLCKRQINLFNLHIKFKLYLQEANSNKNFQDRVTNEKLKLFKVIYINYIEIKNVY